MSSSTGSNAGHRIMHDLSSTSSPNPDQGGGANGPSDTPEELLELRRILVGEEAAQVQRLEHRVDRVVAMEEEGQVDAMSRTLPEAIARHGDDARALAQALSPTIEKTVHLSIRRNPKPFVDALFPIIGPVIRRSIAEALRSMVETINRTLEHSLSARSIQWRLEAMRTGRPFSEVVLTHTLAYRVEHLFLIERASGLPLQHVSAEGASTLDSDVISGMMSAVQEFMRASFGASKDQGLNRVEMGDLTLLIEPGPRAVLAAVFRGVLTREMRERLQELIESIHLQYGPDFVRSAGKPEAFAHVRPLLHAGLLMETRPVAGRSTRWFWIVLGLLFLGSAVWLAQRTMDYLRFDAYVDQLRATPGVAVLDVGRRDGQWYVEGLRDLYAEEPAQVEGLDLAAIDQHWQPFIAQDAATFGRRLAAEWGAPAGVVFSLSGDSLRLSGEASYAWTLHARRRARLTPGIRVYDDRDLRVAEADSAAIAAEFAHTVVLFDPGSAVLRPADVERLERLAAAVSWWMRQRSGRAIAVVGHASPEGSLEANRRLRIERAEAVRVALVAGGVPEEKILVEEGPVLVGPSLEGAAYLNRSITIEGRTAPREEAGE
jgi:OOP family OmpA-OmpF porin